VSRESSARRPGRFAIVCTVAVALLAATCGWSQPPAGAAGEGAGARPELPAFDLAAAGGGRMRADDLRGRVALVEFWATWCTPCHVQVEILKSLYPSARAAGVEFVAVATGEPEAIVRDFLAKSPYPYPSLLDPDEKLGTALQVLGLPTLVVVDREGRIVWRQTGLTDRETILDALAEAGAEIAD
jgi:thiol-disulfide isomerase/thioredoxin